MNHLPTHLINVSNVVKECPFGRFSLKTHFDVYSGILENCLTQKIKKNFEMLCYVDKNSNATYF